MDIRKILLAASIAFLSACAAGAADYRIMTCNIRITGLEADAAYSERVWENRRDLCVETIRKENPDIFCLQEVIYDSYRYFVQKFGRKYGHFGFEGPEMDPYAEGYHLIGKNVIFWNSRRFEFVSSGNYWLSETPVIAGSMSWGTARARHVNWVRLRDRRTGEEIRVIDTHLDHKSDRARRRQIEMIMEECSQYSIPQILCGDFNAGIGSEPVECIRAAEGWREMWESVHGETEAGFTAHGFKGVDYQPKKNRRIDFIWYKGDIKVKSCEILKNHEGSKYPSDHFFIAAEFSM